MELFLTIAVTSILSAGICAAVFGAALRRSEQPASEGATPPRPARVRAQRFFFGEEVAARPSVPAETLLAQVVRHVHQEQAAAESFVDEPTVESLHTRSVPRADRSGRLRETR